MWSFKKKPVEVITLIVNTIICIPGYWEDTADIFGNSSGSLMAVGGVLMDIKNECHFGFELCDRDERMRRSFEVAGSVTGVTADFLNEIDNHKSVIYINSKTGSYKEAKLIALMAAKLLDAGGIGVKVETTGKAFEKDRWGNLANLGLDENLYELFVLDSLVSEDRTVFSCGMHNLGLKDTIISGLDVEEALSLARIFNYYQVIDKPVIKANQTFSSAVNAPRYIITEEFNQPYKGEELFKNPFGMWRLTRI